MAQFRVRFSASMESSVYDLFQAWMEEKGLANRSLALSHLITHCVHGDQKEEPSGDHTQIVSLLYNRHKRDIAPRLRQIAYEYYSTILDIFSVSLGECNILDLVILRGNPKTLRKVKKKLLATQGVLSHNVMCAMTHMLRVEEEACGKQDGGREPTS